MIALRPRIAILWIVLALLVAASVSTVLASVQTQAGPYRVEIATDPSVIPAGSAKLRIKVTDAVGKPVEGAQVSAIAQMPGMPMGEREEAALPQAGQPGVYAAPARFAMAGGYEATIHIQGSQGNATAKIPLQTGQNTGALSTEAGGGGKSLSLWPLLPWLLGAGLLVFILYRMRKTGLMNARVLAGLALLVVVSLVSAWAVHTYTKPGHMSVIEAQAIDMSVMKPPVGAAPVAAMAVQREPIASSVSYTGSAVSFQDVEVTPRVTGALVWMPFYPGDRVRAGQVVARLDTAELQSRESEQA